MKVSTKQWSALFLWRVMMGLMEEIVLGIILAIVGAAMGSFAGATVWRLRAWQLVEEKKSGQKVDSQEYRKLVQLTKGKLLSDRSVDFDTGKQLQWFELIPVLSWLFLRGKSRHSGKPIGYFELLIELGVAAFFVASFVLWPYPLGSGLEVARFIIWLIAGVLLAIQFATDFKWSILWSLVGYLIIGLGVIFSLLTIAIAPDTVAAIWSTVGSAMVLGGLYFVLFAVSKERWVGFGDVVLGLGLGLLLADWKLALVALFLANLIGSVIALVGFAWGKMSRGQHVPFGPFFIAGAVIAQLVGGQIVTWYISVFLP